MQKGRVYPPFLKIGVYFWRCPIARTLFIILAMTALLLVITAQTVITIKMNTGCKCSFQTITLLAGLVFAGICFVGAFWLASIKTGNVHPLVFIIVTFSTGLLAAYAVQDNETHILLANWVNEIFSLFSTMSRHVSIANNRVHTLNV